MWWPELIIHFPKILFQGHCGDQPQYQIVNHFSRRVLKPNQITATGLSPIKRCEGWDPATGWPLRMTLDELGLSDVANTLSSRGRL